MIADCFAVRGHRLVTALAVVLVSGLGCASTAGAATWGSPVPLPSSPLNDPYDSREQVVVDPLAGPTLMATTFGDTKLEATDLRTGAWTPWQQLATPSPVSTGLGLPYQLAAGANGDMVASWVECNSNQSACLLKASVRLSGANWEPPVTVYDPAQDTSQGAPWVLESSTLGGTTVADAIDGSGNATIAWLRINSGGGKDIVTRHILADGTLTDVKDFGYGYQPTVVASANGYVTIVDLGSFSATTETPADVQAGTLPGHQIVPLPTGDGALGVTTDANGHATILGGNSFDDTNGLVTSTEDSNYAWRPSVPIPGSSVSGAPLAAGPWIVEDAAGGASVMWVPPGSGGANGEGMLSDLAPSGSAWSNPIAVADSSHTVASAFKPMAVNAAGDLVVAWTSPSGQPGQTVIYARYRRTGGQFDAPTPLQGNSALAAVVDNNGVATVVEGGGTGNEGQSQSTGAAATVAITNPGDQTGTVGTPVSLQIHASDSDNGTLSYAATGLPAGLSIDPTSGLISGTPTTATAPGAPASVTVTATDVTGPAKHVTFSWTIAVGTTSSTTTSSTTTTSSASSTVSSSTSSSVSSSGTSSAASTDTSSASSSASNASSSVSDTTSQGSFTLPAITTSPGVTQPATCSTSGRMKNFIGKVWDSSVTALQQTRDLTVIERHPSHPPGGKRQVGEVYSQTPKAGFPIDPCTTHVRLVIYGGPNGLSVADYKILKSLDGHELDTAQLPAGWKVSYHFQPKAQALPTIEKVELISARHHQIRLDVAMPADRTAPFYTATLARTAPFNGATNYLVAAFPAPGTDGALGADLKPQLFGELVWSPSGAPIDANLIVDTHEIADVENKDTDNLTASQTAETKNGAAILTGGTRFKVNPHKDGHIYVVACAPTKVAPCIPLGMDSIPVVRRHAAFDSENGYRYSANGDYDGVVAGVSGVKGRARERAHGAADCTGICELWSRFVYFLGHGSGGGGETTVSAGAKPAPPAEAFVDARNLLHTGPVQPSAQTAPTARLVYDFSTGLYPLLESSSTGLPPGQVYQLKDGKAINLLDRSSHDIIGAGAGNVQPNEVFGIIGAGAGNVIAAGGGNVISAGGGNLIPNAPYLDADAYGLAPGTYQISRDSRGVVATPVNVVAAGGGNVVAAGGGNVIGAGGGNIIAAGAGNLANGYYNIISAGGGNIISAGGGNVISAGGGNLTGYQALAATLPESWLSNSATTSLIENGVLATNNLVQVGGREAASVPADIPSLASPGQYVTPADGIIGAGGANVISAGGGNVISAGGGNVISAGGGNVVAAGGGNVVAAGGGNAIYNHNAGIIGAGAGNVTGAGPGNIVGTGAGQ